MMKPALAVFAIVAAMVAFAYGWVANLVSLLSLPSLNEHVGEALVRTFGIVVPFIGAVAGYF